MKPVTVFFLAMCLLLNAKSQSQLSWKEMNDFHATAMAAFHSAEIDQLQTVRDSAAAILRKAKEWNSSLLPARCNPSVVKPLLQALVSQCDSIYEGVKANIPDKTLKPVVGKAHDIFHMLVNKCK